MELLSSYSEEEDKEELSLLSSFVNKFFCLVSFCDDKEPSLCGKSLVLIIASFSYCILNLLFFC